MCLTFLESEKQPLDTVYFNDDYVISIKKNNNDEKQSFAFIGFEHIVLNKYNNFKIAQEKTLDFRSNKKTVLLFVPNGSYHLLVDFFNKIINLLEKNKNFELLLNFSFHNFDNLEPTFDKTFLKFLFDFLNDHNIEYKIIQDWTNIDHIIINDFIIFNKNNWESSPITHKLFLKYFKKYIKNIDQKPFRKVYLNRESYTNRKIYNTKLSYNQDERIKNEEILEKYLNNNGFECISLEGKFNTFEEQVNYFYSVKTLVTVTSAGLTNCIYMQPGSVLLELVTPQVVEHTTNYGESLGVSIHSLWQPLTSVKEIDHISISNMKRDANDIIYKINNSSYLKNVVL